jgi:hypothetical protein
MVAHEDFACREARLKESAAHRNKTVHIFENQLIGIYLTA